MAASGSFDVAFGPGFDGGWEHELPSGVLDTPLMRHIWLNDFNKRQEIDSTWNK